MAAYSFLNFQGAILGAGGAFSLGSGEGVSDEGITTSMVEEKNLATPGADGKLMHTLRASNVGKLTVRLLKTSSANAKLSLMYNLQKANPATWGANTITVSDIQRGDVAILSEAAFVKLPDVTWDKDGKMIEWEFIGNLNEQLGFGVPDVNV